MTAGFVLFAPIPEPLRNLEPLTARYLDVNGRLIAELAGTEARSHRPVPLEAMGPWLPVVTVALEDQRFYSHPGIDLRAIGRAVVTGHGGGSTITQQLIKVALGHHRRSLANKLREALLAVQLERHWSKAQILAAYLNRVSYGNRLLGAEAASQGYFGKPAAELSKAEAVYLAVLPRKPSRFNPWRYPSRAEIEFERAREKLVRRGVFPGDEPVLLPRVGRHLPENQAPHFIQIAARIGDRGEIGCTLDLDMQRRATERLRGHLDTLQRPDISQGALVILENQTGAVRALVGSRDFARCQINGALRFRNSGSTLKPFLYAAGIERRVLTAATLLPDTADAARDAYRDYDPHNFVVRHLGPVRVREALGNSLNVPAVVALERLGARQVFDAIGLWGVRFDRPLEKAGAGFILGNVGVRLLDLTAAFAGLARGGLVSPTRVREADPKPLRRVVSPETASIITDILCDNSARLHSFGPNSVLALPIRVAVKTGTSSGYRDAWTVGFNRDYTVGVWVGNFDGRPMDHAGSVAAAGPLWRRVMEELPGGPVPESTLARVPVCRLTGLLPCTASPGTLEELFLPGTEPTESARAWFDSQGRPLLTRDYAGWCAAPDNHLLASVRPESEPLAIVTPRNGSVFLLDENLPRSQQQVQFRVNGSEPVEWRVNGTPVPPGADGRVLWALQEGSWAVEAVGSGARADARFEVRRP